jgi:hypothetical protein
MVLELSVEIWALPLVPEPRPETITTEKTSILKQDTEDVLLQAIRFLTAESMEDQTTMTRALKLMSDVLDNGNQLQLVRLDLNSESPVLPQDGYTEKERMDNGDHLPPTTSGTTTMVLPSSVRTLDSLRVLEVNRETTKTENFSTPKLDTEDVLITTETFFNAESMVDQTTMTEALTLMLLAQENHGYQNT